MSSEILLMIFIKNPVLGKVKTRLAESIGNEKSLEVYHALLDHTLKITQKMPVDKAVFYSDRIEPGDQWTQSGFTQLMQEGDDLGEKMYNAFRYAFQRDYRSAVIIGSDCLELSSAIISNAFRALGSNDVAIGPAVDGGYYLLGMKKLQHDFFINKAWSSPRLLQQTLATVSNLNLTVKLLETLSDIDTAVDLEKHRHLFPAIYSSNIAQNPN